jgi:16S rRNA (guanine527-N7)-methyltransferase
LARTPFGLIAMSHRISADILASRISAGLELMQLECDDERIGLLARFLELLSTWNRTYNLTAIVDPSEMVTRHVLDSLSVAAHLRGSRHIDVGSGAGLPGIPLAIWFPQQEFHLLDSNGKKMRFLFHVKRSLQLDNVFLHQQRVESFNDPAGFDNVMSRAFASLGDMLRLCQHLLAPAGCFLAMKGSLDPGELAAIIKPYTLESRIELAVPGIPGERQLLRISRQAVPIQ